MLRLVTGMLVAVAQMTEWNQVQKESGLKLLRLLINFHSSSAQTLVEQTVKEYNALVEKIGKTELPTQTRKTLFKKLDETEVSATVMSYLAQRSQLQS